MSSPQLLETAVAILVHGAVVVAAVEILSRRCSDVRKCDRLWTACHVALILVVAGDLAMPHLRLWPMPLMMKTSLPQILQLESSLCLIVAAIWGCGAAATAVRLIAGSRRVVRLFKAARPLASKELLTTCQQSLEHGRPLQSDVQFLASDLCASPFCWQIHRPMIILPQLLLNRSAKELSPVIRHELEHLRLGHPLSLFLQRIVGVLLWCHPAAWWAARQAHRYREFVCDDAAVDNCDEAVGYLRCLLQLTQSADAQRIALAGLSLGGRPSLIAERSERLANRTWQATHSGRYGCWPAFPYLLAIMLAIVAWIPLDPHASRRSLWSPWPHWTAQALMSLGVEVRDYEIDGHRFGSHEVHTHLRPGMSSSSTWSR